MLAHEWRAWVEQEIKDVMVFEQLDTADALSLIVARLDDRYYVGPGEHELTDRNSNHCLTYARQKLKEMENAEE